MTSRIPPGGQGLLRGYDGGWPGQPLDQTTDLATEGLEDQVFMIG